MNTDYWIRRWQDSQTGWHRDTVMPLLLKHWPELSVPSGTTVLVPFCGKTLDMLWLATQGLHVLGVEISAVAVDQFFSEHDLQPEKQYADDGIHYRADNIEIIQGDLFGLDSGTLASCGAVYDRAAIIALPPELRERYAHDIYAKLPKGCRGLMITLDYPQAEMDGPPFSVDEPEVRRLLDDWHVELTEHRDILSEQPTFREAGLTSLHNTVYPLRRI